MKVVFPWSTCPQVVIFRVVSEFDPIERKEKERWLYLSTCHSASSIPTTFTATPPPLLPETETMTVLRYDHFHTLLALSNVLPG